MSLISEHSAALSSKGSPIRLMFELGKKLERLHGKENVFDFSLGNPALEPPKEFVDALARLSTGNKSLIHGYTPNRGLPTCLEAIARRASKMHDDVPVPPENVIVTCGAAGAINVFFRTVCDASEEIIVFAPFFGEYAFYADQVACKLVVLSCDKDTLEPDVESLRKALSPKTRAVIVNSPNNPSGKIMSQQCVDGIAAALEEMNVARAQANPPQRPAWLVSDEPYAKIVYGTPPPRLSNVFASPLRHTLVVTSFSKDLSIPGERIGYAAVDPRAGTAEEIRALMGAMTVHQRTLGFVNAPAIMQQAIVECADASVDVSWYDERRKAMVQGLREAGLTMAEPEGAFYAFPQCPDGVSDRRFSSVLADQRVLCVPGTAFGMPGFVRFSYAVQSLSTIERACAIVKQVVADLKSGKIPTSKPSSPVPPPKNASHNAVKSTDSEKK